ncbi:MAG: hypothetical protein OXC80_07155 [Gammaproteobacteria bacterium]|nr:hypothetical protein [Gammaproteobacteria bacterium]
MTQTKQKRLLLYWLGSIVTSAVLFTAIVLPAEYSIDPLKVGELLGIKGMSSTSTITLDSKDSARTISTHTTSFTLQPFESLEIKYALNENESVLYSWQSHSGEVLYELHSHPWDAPSDFADTYERQNSVARSGLYQADYDGLHGWFWENRGLTTTTIQLSVSGFYYRVILYRDGREEEIDPTKDQKLY